MVGMESKTTKKVAAQLSIQARDTESQEVKKSSISYTHTHTHTHTHRQTETQKHGIKSRRNTETQPHPAPTRGPPREDVGGLDTLAMTEDRPRLGGCIPPVPPVDEDAPLTCSWEAVLWTGGGGCCCCCCCCCCCWDITLPATDTGTRPTSRAKLSPSLKVHCCKLFHQQVAKTHRKESTHTQTQTHTNIHMYS